EAHLALDLLAQVGGERAPVDVLDAAGRGTTELTTPTARPPAASARGRSPRPTGPAGGRRRPAPARRRTASPRCARGRGSTPGAAAGRPRRTRVQRWPARSGPRDRSRTCRRARPLREGRLCRRTG